MRQDGGHGGVSVGGKGDGSLACEPQGQQPEASGSGVGWADLEKCGMIILAISSALTGWLSQSNPSLQPKKHGGVRKPYISRLDPVHVFRSFLILSIHSGPYSCQEQNDADQCCGFSSRPPKRFLTRFRLGQEFSRYEDWRNFYSDLSFRLPMRGH